jgi:hypothetical protein
MTMNNFSVISTAFCLPAPEIEALLDGRMIAVMLRHYVNPDKRFALCPVDASINLLPVERYYHSNFLTYAEYIFAQVDAQVEAQVNSEIGAEIDAEIDAKNITIKAWANCEECQIIGDNQPLAALSKLTLWTEEALQKILQERGNIFLAYLRVYLLDEEIQIPLRINKAPFVLQKNLTVSEANPVLLDKTFAQRKKQLKSSEPSQYRELDELQTALATLAITNPTAKKLEWDVQIFLGLNKKAIPEQREKDTNWIKTIAALGSRSIELEEKKSSYQAGTDFENIARRSLDFLGFKVQDEYKGGAGGLDLFCSQPYPLVCECKAGNLFPVVLLKSLLSWVRST